MSTPNDSINNINYALASSTNVSVARGLVLLVLDISTSLILPLIRHGMGERYLSLFMVIVMMAATFLTCVFFKVDTAVVSLYMGLLAIACTYHFLVIILRNWRDEIVYSRFEGESNFLPIFRFLPKGSRHFWIEGLYEPLLVWVIGLVIYSFVDVSLGSIFSMSAGAMFIRARYRYWMWRQEVMDERDAMIESEHRLEALNGSPAKETRGFVVQGAAHMKPSEKRAKARKILSPQEFEQQFPEPPRDFSSLQAANE